MKVVVTKYLNVRVGKPSVNAPCYQYLAPGSELEVDGKEYSGDEYDKIDIWYKDEAGNYYWSGGVKTVDIQEARKSDDFDIEFDSYSGNGQGVGIAILDSGVNQTHSKIGSRVKFLDSLIQGKSLTNMHDHGHKVAGIIASDDKKLKRNSSDLYCYRVSGDFNDVHDYAVLDSLIEIQSTKKYQNIDLINMSINIADNAYVDLLQSEINNLIDHGVVCVIAAGENYSPNLISKLQKVIKVGVFSTSNLDEITNNGKPQYFDTFLLDVEIPTYSFNGKSIDETIRRDSAYTAFVTAILAKFISNNNPVKDKSRLKTLHDYINSISTEIKLPVKPFKFYQ